MKAFGGLGGAFLIISYTSDKISFHENTPSADTIEDSDGLLRQKGLMPGMSLTISGSSLNDKTVTLDTVTDAVATLIAGDDLTDESEGASVTLTSASMGAQIMGFRNIALDDGIGSEDTTCYEDYPYEKHEVSFQNWTANPDGFWMTEALKHQWMGQEFTFRFFVRRSSSPSASDPAVYYQGNGKVHGLPVSIPLKEMVKQSLNIVGNGALSLTVKTTAW